MSTTLAIFTIFLVLVCVLVATGELISSIKESQTLDSIVLSGFIVVFVVCTVLLVRTNL